MGDASAVGVVGLASLRVSPRDEADLRWLFTEAIGDMGLRSAMGAQLDRLRDGGSQKHRGSKPMGTVREEDDGISFRQVEAAHRFRLISERLERVSQRHQRVLTCLYGATLTEACARRLSAFGPLGAVVLLVADRRHIGRLAVYEASGRATSADSHVVKRKATGSDDSAMAARAKLADGQMAKAMIHELILSAELAASEACAAYRAAERPAWRRKAFARAALECASCASCAAVQEHQYGRQSVVLRVRAGAAVRMVALPCLALAEVPKSPDHPGRTEEI